METEPPQMPVEACKGCGNPPEEGYRIQLCPDCRTALANRPLPVWIKIVGLIVCAILVYALSRVPSEISAGIAFEQGRKAEARGNYAAAESDYKKVVSKFPDSTLAIARLGIAQFRNHDMQNAAKTLDMLHGRHADTQLTQEVNGVITEMDKEFH